MSQGTRGQAAVLGVALLLAIAVASLAALTAGVGSVVSEHAARADADRVAAGFASLEPVETTGIRTVRMAFTEGTVFPVDRDLRLYRDGELVEHVHVDGLVFEHGRYRVIFVAGAVVRGHGPGATLAVRPPIVASPPDGARGVLVVGAPRLGSDVTTVSGSDGVVLSLHADVAHRRTGHGPGTYRLAVETAVPGAWRAYLNETGARVTVGDIDGDGTPSVVARYPGVRDAYLVVHDLGLRTEGSS